MAKHAVPTMIRWPADWMERIDELKRPEEPAAAFVREICRPILAGEVIAERDAEGRVTGFAEAPNSRRVDLSPSPRQGRPASSD